MMKKLFLLLMVLVSFSFAENIKDHFPNTSEISEVNDKEFLLNYFQKTTDELEKSISGLSEAQIQHKPSKEEWSVSQVLEHIILTEEMLFGMMRETMEKPANPERRSEIQFSDDQIMQGMTDRSQKAKASAEITGEGKYNSPEEAMEELLAQRQTILEYIRNIPVKEMRDRVNDSPFGPVDAYQSFLFIAGHTARHTLQIEEIKASESFPSE